MFLKEVLCSPRLQLFDHKYSKNRNIGSLVNDCLLSYFCCPCIWCQMSREMDASEPVTRQTLTMPF
uniref:Uncharacterized protein n=1 Tax=Sinocyclocheilus anshuiensis TaxID=1608454 RepID=A0A671NZC7_9TELE